MSEMFKRLFLAFALLIPLDVLPDDDEKNIPEILQLNAEDAYLTRLVAAISE